MNKKIFILTSLFFLQSCAMAGTKMTAYKDPSANNKTYTKLVVVASTTDLMAAQQIENTFVKALQTKGINAISDKKLFPPTRSYTKTTARRVLSKNKIDGILLIKMTDQHTKNIPVAHSYVAGNNVYTNVNSISKLRQKHNIALKDAKTLKIVWVSSAYTRGNGFARSKTLTNSLARKTIAELYSGNFIKVVSQK